MDRSMETQIVDEIRNKRVLFITTKNLDYIRNTQELNIINKYAFKVDVIGFKEKSYAKRLWKVYRKLLLCSASDYDVFFVGFAPQLILPLWMLKFRKNTIIIDFFISVFDTFVCDRKKIGEKSIAAKLMKHIDKKTLKYADKIIVDTKAHGRYFIEELGAEKEKVYTLYLEADEEIYYPRIVEKEKEFEDKFLVLYFGSILPVQGVDVILETIKKLETEDDIFFLVIGPIEKRFELVQTKNVRYIPWLEQEKLADYIAMADLCLAGHFNKENGKANRTIPGKAYIYKAMNKKVIFGNSVANRELYKEDDNENYFVEMGDSTLLAKLIKRIYLDGVE